MRIDWVAKDVCGVCSRSYGHETSCYCVLFELMLLFSKWPSHFNLCSYFLKSTTMIRFFLLHIFLARRCFCQLKQCYFIDGTLSADLPCDPSANVSACCGQSNTCATNFYCVGGTAVKNREEVGSCTDKTWHDPACPLPLSQPITPSLHLEKFVT